MRRRSIRNPELNACPMCRKVVEYGMQCEACASWFHATEQCCGDALANAFTTTGRDAWTCLNCFPQQGVAPAADTSKKHAATIDHLDWRRAFRILTDSCAGCGLKVRVCRRRAALFFSREKSELTRIVLCSLLLAGPRDEPGAALRDVWPLLPRA